MLVTNSFSSRLTLRRYLVDILKNVGNQTVLFPIDFKKLFWRYDIMTNVGKQTVLFPIDFKKL